MTRIDPATHQNATFDEIYARVPREQVARLKMFRQDHPYKRLTAGDMQWQYISCGRGDDDPAISPRDRALLRNTYPQARVHTFADAGHASTILRREAVVSLIRAFLRELQIQ